MTLVEGTTDPLWVLPTLPLWVFVAKMEGLYDADHPRIWHLTTDEAPAIFHWITLSVAGSLFFIRALPDETIRLDSAVTLYVVTMGAAFVLRSIARAIWRRRVPPERALVLGQGKLADAVSRKLALEPGHHLSVLEYSSGDDYNGFNGSNGGGHSELKIEELSKEDLDFLLAEAGVERVVLALPELDEATLARVVTSCRATGVKLSVMPPMRAMLGTAVQLNHIAEMPVIEYGTWGTSPSTMAIKRAADVVLSAVGIVILAPLMLVIALAVRLTSRGPALFRQIRAGRDGKPFKILKFRTMCRDAEERISEVISPDELAEPMFKLRKDPRVTKVGPHPEAHQSRRAAAAVQRAARGHEPGGPAPRGAVAGRALRRDAALPAPDATRPDRADAGARARRAELPGAPGSGARVRRELQHPQGPEDPAADGLDHLARPGRLLALGQEATHPRPAWARTRATACPRPTCRRSASPRRPSRTTPSRRSRRR